MGSSGRIASAAWPATPGTPCSRSATSRSSQRWPGHCDGYEGSYERWWADFRSRPAFTKEGDADLIDAYAMAACYSAEPDGTVRCRSISRPASFVAEIWCRWLAWDPVRVARTEAGIAALRGLRAIYIDAGTRDEYHLDLGAEAFRRACLEAGSVAPFFELFDARHGGIEYRYPIALRYLAERLG